MACVLFNGPPRSGKTCQAPLSVCCWAREMEAFGLERMPGWPAWSKTAFACTRKTKDFRLGQSLKTGKGRFGSEICGLPIDYIIFARSLKPEFVVMTTRRCDSVPEGLSCKTALAISGLQAREPL